MVSLYQKKVVSYGFLIVLTLLLLTNFFLTFWIVSSIGMNLGILPFLQHGSPVKTHGNLFSMESLIAHRIVNSNGLLVQALNNISIIAATDNQHHSSILMNENSIKMFTKKFVVKDNHGQTVFKSDAESTDLASKKLHIHSKGGHNFRSSIETQKIRAGPGNSLDISSTVGQLTINGPQKIDFKSFGGDINMHALTNVQINTKGQGLITLRSGSIKLPGLIKSLNQTTRATPRQTSTSSSNLAYQLCACRDGKLFVTESSGSCVADYHICFQAS